MKIISWNVNGIRSVFKTTFRDWLNAEDPDIVCIQETKCDYTELTEEYTQINGYYAYFNSSCLKKGHSGVAVYTKIKPENVETIVGIARFDDEGRCLKLTFKDFVLFNFYIPNGARDKHEMPYKLDVYTKLIPLLSSHKDQNVILAGDFNIAHHEIDVYHAKNNYGNTMFTPEERSQISALIDAGYIDTFRYKYPDKKAYTWWPYMLDLRERDVGWRIDYIFVTHSLKSKVEDAFMQRHILGSDHGPLGIILDLPVAQAEKPVYKKVEAQPSLF